MRRLAMALLLLLILMPVTLLAQTEDTEGHDSIAIARATITAYPPDTLATDTLVAPPWPQLLQARLDTIVAQTTILRTSQMGLMVYDLTADSAVYAYGERQTLRPASTMKLLTAITALDKLGGAYLYKTQLRYTGEVIDSLRTLQGDIYIIGGMDPMLSNDDLRSFASAIKEMGIDTLRGNVYADRSMKDADLLGEGWCWDDDNPPLSPLVFGRKDNAIDRFMQLLTAAGVYVTGEQGEKKCPTTGSNELEARSHSISQILFRMMKDSDNLYAESMLYQIGLTQGRPSTARKARAVMETLMRKMGLASRPHRFADGSGLSLYNYVSAEIEVAFLRYAWQNADIWAYLYDALPIAGVDGTLEKRMRGTAAAHNVHAKTGTLAGVSSLAGYCTAANGHELCFAIINQNCMKANAAKALQDSLCDAICR